MSEQKRTRILNGLLIIAALLLVLVHPGNQPPTAAEIEVAEQTELNAAVQALTERAEDSRVVEHNRLMNTMLEHGCTSGNFCELYVTKKGVALKMWNNRYFSEGPLFFQFEFEKSVIQEKADEYGCTYDETCIAILTKTWMEERGDETYIAVRLVNKEHRKLVYFKIS
jgi:hypothetical protein